MVVGLKLIGLLVRSMLDFSVSGLMVEILLSATSDSEFGVSLMINP